MKIFALVPFLFLVACSSTDDRKPFTSAECGFDGGRERGFSEGKKGWDPDTDYASLCREEVRDGVRKGYREGYDQGRVEYKQTLADWKKLQDERRAKKEALDAPVPPTYQCSITYRSRGFHAQGKSTQEAHEAVVEQCAKAFPRRFCAPLPQCSDAAVAAPASLRAYYCRLEVFGRTHEAFASTEMEARVAARRKCNEEEGDDSIFCAADKAKCEKNK